ncbi:MAG: rRNA maturation RNase YbeY [Nitrospiraceae bacterium]|nr:rRNA maturation RNase YbeY [Nitrospiraceae bacterium]
MTVELIVRNDSTRKGLYRSDALRRLAQRICAGEGEERDTELSLLLCDDPFIADLNRRYRKRNCPTDVLAFGQVPESLSPAGHPYVLGDIVVSLETVETRCFQDRAAMRQEVRALFCHGLLHLLGCTHDTDAERKAMFDKQDEYLGVRWEPPAKPRG